MPIRATHIAQPITEPHYMLERYIRPVYQQYFVNHPARLIAGRISPNQVSSASLIAGIGAATAICMHAPIVATALLLLSGYLDTLDGTVARLSGKSSSFGAMWDIICDRLVEIAFVLSLTAIALETRAVGGLLMLSGILIVVTSFLTAAMVLPNESEKSFNYTPNLMERPEAFIFFIAMIWLPSAFNALAYAFTALVCYTALVRVMQVKHALQQ